MSKFDRCIFISIAIGIWALAMTQVFKPSTAVAIGDGCGVSSSEPCYVAQVKLGYDSVTGYGFVLSEQHGGTLVYSE